MTHFRKRFDADFINDMNELIVRKQLEKSSNNSKNDPPNKGGGTSSLDESSESPEDEMPQKHHQGKLLIDATCAQADIAYPTDVGLLNKAREKLESMMDRFIMMMTSGRVARTTRTI